MVCTIKLERVLRGMVAIAYRHMEEDMAMTRLQGHGPRGSTGSGTQVGGKGGAMGAAISGGESGECCGELWGGLWGVLWGGLWEYVGMPFDDD